MSARIDRNAMHASNRALVLRLIRESPQTSRIDLSRRTGLAKPTVSTIVEELMKDGLVREVGWQGPAPAGGRRARLLEFDASTESFLGIDLGENEIAAALADAHGRIIDRERRSALRSPERALDEAARLAQVLRKRCGSTRRPPSGVAVSVHGLVDRNRGACVFAPNLGWKNVAIREPLKAKLGLPVELVNVAHAAALAEQRDGVARGFRSFLWVAFGNGIGSGIVIDGKLFVGEQGFAGEIGHCCLDPEGPPCSCGMRGCVEQFAAVPAILKRSTATWSPPRRASATFDDVLAAAAKGDEGVGKVLADAGRALGLGISYALNILNVERVVVGGSDLLHDLQLQSVRETIRSAALRGASIEVVRSTLAQADVCLGGAVLAARNAFRDEARPATLAS